MTSDAKFSALWPVEPAAPTATVDVPTVGSLDGGLPSQERKLCSGRSSG
jgi:hypothetical protein